MMMNYSLGEEKGSGKESGEREREDLKSGRREGAECSLREEESE